MAQKKGAAGCCFTVKKAAGVPAGQLRESHGMARSPEYRAWIGIRQCCLDPNYRDFEHYGARGITMCATWVASFAQFYADMGARPGGHVLKRRDSQKGFTKANCCWAPKSEKFVSNRPKGAARVAARVPRTQRGLVRANLGLPPPKPKVGNGVTPSTVEDLKARCDVQADTGCWLWLGALSDDGRPRIFTFDHERGQKRVMSGTVATWHIVHKRGPKPGHELLRSCNHLRCLNPDHMEEKPMDRKATAKRRIPGRRGNVVEVKMPSGASPIKMLADQACGVKPGEVTAVARRLRPKSTVQEDTAGLLASADALVTWWGAERPPGWTVEQHLEHPTINLPHKDHALALAAAGLVRLGW